MTPKSDIPQGALDLLILRIVALGPVHGYAIAQRLQQVSRDVVQVPQGSLYPALHWLENRGLLDNRAARAFGLDRLPGGASSCSCSAYSQAWLSFWRASAFTVCWPT
jgi:hypothetical protein